MKRWLLVEGRSAPHARNQLRRLRHLQRTYARRCSDPCRHTGSWRMRSRRSVLDTAWRVQLDAQGSLGQFFGLRPCRHRPRNGSPKIAHFALTRSHIGRLVELCFGRVHRYALRRRLNWGRISLAAKGPAGRASSRTVCRRNPKLRTPGAGDGSAFGPERTCGLAPIPVLHAAGWATGSRKRGRYQRIRRDQDHQLEIPHAVPLVPVKTDGAANERVNRGCETRSPSRTIRLA